MPIKVETYQSADGKFHATEVEAIRHEALNALGLAVPEIRDRWPLIVNNIDKIADALQHLAAYRAENHPALPAHTTLEPSTKPRWATCLPEGYVQKGIRIYLEGRTVDPMTGKPCPYLHPKFTACPHCAGWKVPEGTEPPVADEPEDVGCDCGALLAGNAGSDHLKTCSLEVERRRDDLRRVGTMIDEHVERTLRD